MAGPAAFLLLAALIAVAAVFWPLFALLLRVACELLDGNARADVLNSRQAVLLLKTLGIAASAALLSVLLSVPAAMLVSTARGATRPLFYIALSAVLLCPPMVYAFGWQRILPAAIDGHLLCIFIWSAWVWPLAAFLLAPGLRAHRNVFESAMLDAGRARAILHVLLPAIWPQVAVAAASTFILFLGDYSVPHACGLIVYATETLGWASNSTRAIDTLAPAIPGAIFVALGLVALTLTTRRALSSTSDRPIPVGIGPCIGTAALLAVTWFVPLIALIFHLESANAVRVAAATYGHDIAWTFMAAAAGGLAVCSLATACAGLKRSLVPLAFLLLLLGALPGALIGKALVTAYNNVWLGSFYDSWLIVTAGYVARFAWLGALASIIVARDLRSPIADQAALDGASRWSTLFRLIVPGRAGMLVALTLIVVALSLGEAAMTSLVRVPAFAPVSLVIIEKFHRLEDDMLISLSLLVVAASLPAAAAIGWLSKDKTA